jgi:RNA polymerase-binding protein DksA
MYNHAKKREGDDDYIMW